MKNFYRREICSSPLPPPFFIYVFYLIYSTRNRDGSVCIGDLYLALSLAIKHLLASRFITREYASSLLLVSYLYATAGSGSLPASPADSGVSDVESSTSSGGNEDANLLLKARLNPNSSLQPSLASHHSHLSSGKLILLRAREETKSFNLSNLVDRIGLAERTTHDTILKRAQRFPSFSRFPGFFFFFFNF